MNQEHVSELRAEIHRCLQHANDANPVWNGVLKLLEFQIGQSIDSAVAPNMPPGVQREFVCGDAAALMAFRESLLANRKQAQVGGES